MFDVKQYKNAADVLTAIDNAGEINWGTNTYDGFNLASEKCFDLTSSDPKVAFLLTDGKSSDSAATIAAAESMRNTLGVNVLGIGVDAADEAELLAIVGDDASKYWTAAKFDDLNTAFAKTATSSACVPVASGEIPVLHRTLPI